MWRYCGWNVVLPTSYDECWYFTNVRMDFIVTPVESVKRNLNQKWIEVWNGKKDESVIRRTRNKKKNRNSRCFWYILRIKREKWHWAMELISKNITVMINLISVLCSVMHLKNKERVRKSETCVRGRLFLPQLMLILHVILFTAHKCSVCVSYLCNQQYWIIRK